MSSHEMSIAELATDIYQNWENGNITDAREKLLSLPKKRIVSVLTYLSDDMVTAQNVRAYREFIYSMSRN